MSVLQDMRKAGRTVQGKSGEEDWCNESQERETGSDFKYTVPDDTDRYVFVSYGHMVRNSG